MKILIYSVLDLPGFLVLSGSFTSMFPDRRKKAVRAELAKGHGDGKRLCQTKGLKCMCSNFHGDICSDKIELFRSLAGEVSVLILVDAVDFHFGFLFPFC